MSVSVCASVSHFSNTCAHAYIRRAYTRSGVQSNSLAYRLAIYNISFYFFARPLCSSYSVMCYSSLFFIVVVTAAAVAAAAAAVTTVFAAANDVLNLFFPSIVCLFSHCNSLSLFRSSSFIHIHMFLPWFIRSFHFVSWQTHEIYTQIENRGRARRTIPPHYIVCFIVHKWRCFFSFSLHMHVWTTTTTIVAAAAAAARWYSNEFQVNNTSAHREKRATEKNSYMYAFTHARASFK